VSAATLGQHEPSGDRRSARRLTAYGRRVSEAIAVISFDLFVEEEQSSERRHELVGGRVYAMAGGSERHDRAAGLLYELLAPGPRSAGCRPFTSNRLVRTRGGTPTTPMSWSCAVRPPTGSTRPILQFS
jgi:Putative restriction endonuclease